MARHRGWLYGWLAAVLFALLCGCGAATFPTDAQGYPRRDVVLVNGAEYPLGQLGSGAEAAVSVPMGEPLEVVLPQYLPTCLWSLPESEMVHLVRYERSSLPAPSQAEGQSTQVQKFVLDVPEGKTISFYWKNIQSMETSTESAPAEFVLHLTPTA